MISYPKVEKPIIYLSGGHTSSTEKEEAAWIKRTQTRFRCFSYAYCCPGAFYYNKRMHKSLDVSRDAGVGVMMDSGAASFHKFLETRASGQISSKKKQKHKLSLNEADVADLIEQTIEQYIEYCQEHWKEWDFFFTFDWKKHCPTIRQITKRLWKAGLKEAVPVFHGDMELDWFRRYCEDGCKVIGIGNDFAQRTTWKGKRYYYDNLFNMAARYSVKLHGLAVTSLSLMLEYPWYAVDSSTWVKTSAYGKIIYIDKDMGVLPQIHISRQKSSHNPSYNTLPKPLQKRIRERVESFGFDFDKVRDDQHERSGFNALMFNTQLHQLKEQIAARKANWEQLI